MPVLLNCTMNLLDFHIFKMLFAIISKALASGLQQMLILEVL
jgi:hypothetical protein